MASAARITRYTPEEYLALERKAEFKSEYLRRIHHRDGRREPRAQYDRAAILTARSGRSSRTGPARCS